MKTKPWLDGQGKELCDEQLKAASQNWAPEIWEDYLQSLESPREESLLAAHEFAKLVENQTESVFVNIGNNASDEDRALVMDMLATLPMKERTVLEHTFLEGRTEREIAEFIGMSNSSVNRIKKRALRRLEAEFGERWSTHRIMRGHIIELPQPKRPKPKAA